MAIAIVFLRFNDLERSVTSTFLLMKKKCEKLKKSIDCKFEYFAKCTIDFRYFLLFVQLCDGFKCLLKGYVLRKHWRHLKSFTDQTHFYII